MANNTTSPSAKIDGDDLLSFELEPVEITLGQLIKLSETFLGLIREVASEVTQAPRDAVRWVVVDVQRASPITYKLRPEPVSREVPRSQMPTLVTAVASGIKKLQERPERPPYFTDRALERASELSHFVDERLPILRLRNGRTVTPDLSRQLATNAAQVLGEAEELKSYGTVEGRLETLSVHGKRYFNVYDDLTGEKIECLFAGSDIETEEIGRAVDRRVSVQGEIAYRETGEIIRVRAEELEVFPREDELPAADDVFGILAE